MHCSTQQTFLGGESPTAASSPPHETASSPSRAPPNPVTQDTNTQHQGCLLDQMDKVLTSPSVILVRDAQNLREGSILVGSIRLGRLLGSGVQA